MHLTLTQARTRELDPGIDMSKYVGGAVVVFDLRLRRVKWQQHLDLSTDSTPYRAYIYSAPVLVDLDRDGKLEVVVGTSAVRTYVQNIAIFPIIHTCVRRIVLSPFGRSHVC